VEEENKNWETVFCWCSSGMEWAWDYYGTCRRCDGTRILYRNIQTGRLAKHIGVVYIDVLPPVELDMNNNNLDL